MAPEGERVSRFYIALRHHQAGRFGEAEPLYREVLSGNAANADALRGA